MVTTPATKPGRPRIEDDLEKQARDSRWLWQLLCAGATLDGIAADEDVSRKTVERGVGRARERVRTIAKRRGMDEVRLDGMRI